MLCLAESSFGRCLESGGQFYICVWQESGFSRHELVFALDLIYEGILYKLYCPVSAI